MWVFIVILIPAIGYWIIQEVLYAKEREKKYQEMENSQYLKQAIRFLAFYHLLPSKNMLIVTPQYIGVWIPDREYNNYFGSSVFAYITACRDQPQFESTFMENFFERNKECLGGDEGIRLFRELGLQMKLHDGDDTKPVIYMALYGGPNFSEQKRYIQALERKYRETYQEQVKIMHLENY